MIGWATLEAKFPPLCLLAFLAFPYTSGAEEPAAATGVTPQAESAPVAKGGGSPVKQQALPEKPAPAPVKPAVAPAEAELKPIKLACKASRNDIGMYEPLRYMTITIDWGKKYVKMVHEGDGRTFEYVDGETGAQGRQYFVRVTDDNVSYGQRGQDSWKIDRYTGTLTSSSITIAFECQVRPRERKF
jgi:hypothetical protein